ncbi:hypothetical protein [Streptomyces sp. NRRL S-146]|uniref:hypothetical protein n=1 Tax=Streptomyces sp. NRRL S-146 TaxID=1463884 RepID=UPI00131EB9DF|nr:hypothetical protein [Streptomyces sp. NRRL S-146]
MATWTAVEALQDQRALITEDNQDKERARAARVTAWRDEWDGKNPRLFVMNRSPDPIISWALVEGDYEDLSSIAARGGSEAELPGDDLVAFKIVPIDAPLDPCSRYLIDLSDYENYESVVAVDFFSSGGDRWRRDLFGGAPEKYSPSDSIHPGAWPPGFEPLALKAPVKRVGKADLCDAT